MGIGFLKGLHLSTFIDTHQEWHALVEGFAEGFCIVRQSKYMPYATGNKDEDLLASLMKEHHYYAMGRALGFATFIILVSGMIVWIVGAIR